MPVTKTQAVERAHYQFVLNDPDFINEFSESDNLAEQNDVIRRYGLNPEEFDVVDYESAVLLKNGYFPFTGGWFRFNEKNEQFEARLNADVKKHEVHELWTQIQRHRQYFIKGRQSKLKSPDDLELLYAIFKARMRKSTYPQIFDMYRQGTLPSYENKPTNNFDTEFDIRKYYLKYYNPI